MEVLLAFQQLNEIKFLIILKYQSINFYIFL